MINSVQQNQICYRENDGRVGDEAVRLDLCVDIHDFWLVPDSRMQTRTGQETYPLPFAFYIHGKI